MRFAHFVLFTLLAFSAMGQTGKADADFVLVTAFGASTVLTDSTWQVECTHPISQLGQGYLPTQIATGFVCMDAAGRRYRVLSNVSSNFGASTLNVVELQDNNLAPIGVGVVYRKPLGADLILIDVQGNTGLSPATIARIQLHNILNTPTSGGGGGDTIDSLYIDGDSLRLETSAGNYAVGIPTVVTDATLSGDGTTGNPLGVSISYLDSAYLKTGGVSIDNLSSEVQNGLYPSAVEVPYTPTFPLTADNVQDALEQVYSLIPGAFVGENALYVSEALGNNATAKIGSYLFPFEHPWAARDSALANGVSNPVIIIFDGDFKYFAGSAGSCGDCDFAGSTQPELSLIRNNFKYVSLPGVKFRSGGGAYNPIELCIFSDTSGYVCQFLGLADFEIFTQNRLCLLQHPNADFTFSCNSISIQAAVAAVFQIRKTAATLNQGGGFRNISVDVAYIKNRLSNAVIFALWATSPFTDTIRANSFSVNLGVFDAQYTNGFVRVDPSYAIIPDFNVNIQTARMQAVPGAGLGFEIFTLGRVGWINSRINLTIQNLIMPTTAPSYQYIYGWTAGRPWTNTVQRLYIGSAVGAWRVFNGIATVAGGTGNKIYWDINGVNEDETDPVYNFGAGGNIGYDMYVSGNLLAKTPLFSYAKATGNLFFLDFNAITTGQLFTSTVSRTDSMFFLNSYLQGSTSPTITGNFPMRTASSTFLPTIPTKNYKTIYSFGEQWRSAVFTATASQSTYTTSTTRLPESGANIRIVVDGLERIEGVSEYYTYVPSTGVITFVTPMTGGEKVKISWYD